MRALFKSAARGGEIDRQISKVHLIPPFPKTLPVIAFAHVQGKHPMRLSMKDGWSTIFPPKP